MVKGRRVKLIDTGEYGNSLDAFKAPNKKYYSSQKAYENIERNKTLYREVYKQLQEILEIDTSIPPIIIKEINQYKERYDVVLEILLRFGSNTREALRSRHIENSFNIARYIGAVIHNNFREVEREMDELTTVLRERRLEEPVDLTGIGCKNQQKDLMKFIGVI